MRHQTSLLHERQNQPMRFGGMILWYMIGAFVATWVALPHFGTAVSFGRTVLYDAPLVLRELATRAGLWNRGLLDTMHIPRSTAEITVDEWERATGIVVMLHGFRAHRHQFNDYVVELRKRDPNLLIVIPDLVQGGNAPLDTVLAALMRDIRWHRSDIQVTWIGISNGARLAMHAITRNWTPEWPRTHAFLLAGPLRGTLRANWARDWVPLCIRRLFVSDAVLQEFIVADSNTVVAAAQSGAAAAAAYTTVHWHLYQSQYDYAIAPTSSSIDFIDTNVKTYMMLYTGHTGMLARCKDSVFAKLM